MTVKVTKPTKSVSKRNTLQQLYDALVDSMFDDQILVLDEIIERLREGEKFDDEYDI